MRRCTSLARLMTAFLVTGGVWTLVSPASSWAWPDARQEQAREAYLSHRLPLNGGAGRGKPDDVGPLDLLSIEGRFEIPEGVMPAGGTWTVTLEATDEVGTIRLLALSWVPLEVLIDGEPVDFVHTPEEALLAVPLAEFMQPGDVLSLTVLAQLDYQCPDATSCVLEGPLRHVVELGWYPLNYEWPLGDRVQVSLQLSPNGGEQAHATGGITDGGFTTELNTLLPAFQAGRYVSEVTDGVVPIESHAPPGRDSGSALRAVAASSLELYVQAFGPYAFSRLGITAIANAANAGLGTQANILLPEGLWMPADHPDFAIAREVTAHEIGHQYFFNTLAVLGPADAWLSEGFAEFAATLHSEQATGRTEHFRRNYFAYMNRVPPEGDQPLWTPELSSSPFYFPIAYQKGSALLHLLRNRLGPVAFEEAMRGYIAAFRDQIVTTPEMTDWWVQNAAVPQSFFDRFVYGAGWPVLIIDAQPPRGDAAPVQLTIRQEAIAGERYLGALPLQVRLADGAIEPARLVLDAAENTFTLEGRQITGLVVDPELTLFRRVRPAVEGDVDLSGVVDGYDLLDLLAAQGQTEADPVWNDALNVVPDEQNMINEADLARVLDQFGAGWSR